MESILNQSDQSNNESPVQQLSTVASSFTQEEIQRHIYSLRGFPVMVDSDIALLYGVETRVLNQAVKRNAGRFPPDFMFQLTAEEFRALRSQIVISNDGYESKGNNKLHSGKSQSVISNRRGGKRYLPYVFTEEGVIQLSAVLRSETAVTVSIRIQRAFVAMRRFLVSNAQIFQRLDSLEQYKLESKRNFEHVDERFEEILDKLEDGTLKHKVGIFFDGQMFDAYLLVEELVSKATKRIVLIDDYVDASVLERFNQHQPGVAIDCYVNKRHITKAMLTAFSMYKNQYPSEHCELHEFNKSHDRWLIIDDTVYHFGASIKDLGKKWFAVDIIKEYNADDLLKRL